MTWTVGIYLFDAVDVLDFAGDAASHIGE